VGLDGHVLDPDGVAVCSDTAGRNSPDVSFDGHNFLVAWQDYRAGTGYSSIYAARVRTDGTVLDPNGFVVAAADTLDDVMPAACFTGTDHLVVWEGHNNNTGDIYIYGALVSPAGTITRPRFRLGLATGQYQREPSVARGSANSLVAWVDINSGAIYATRVRADGAVLDSSGLLVDSTNHTNGLPHVTANEVGFKVLWDNYDMDTTRFAVAQIDTAGDVVRSGLWFGMPGPDNGFDAVYGSGPELLLLFSCWTDTAMGRSYGTDRLWGRLGQVPGIEQADDRLLRSVTGEASVVRGVLFLPRSLDPSLHRSLLDISGRKVLDLKPGANDVRGLAPGVYFVRGTQAQAQAVRKVVVAR
jgi:hypothetical protein